MSKSAVKCPVCNGEGKIREYYKDSTIPYQDRNCHGCNGKGWVEVGTTYG